MTARLAIRKIDKDKVLQEFNHRCSMCGEAKPQLHHIDRNPSNNALENLLSLCPNCYLLDRHSPTTAPPVGKLKLFRKYKDPTIFCSEFEPLFRRVEFIELDMERFLSEEILASVPELIDFIAGLKMGDFYATRIKRLIGPPPRVLIINDDSGTVAARNFEYLESYFEQIDALRAQVYSLVMSLSFQRNSETRFAPTYMPPILMFQSTEFPKKLRDYDIVSWLHVDPVSIH